MLQPLIKGDATIIVGVNLLEQSLADSLPGGLIRALLLAPPLVSKLSVIREISDFVYLFVSHYAYNKVIIIK